MSTAAAAAIWTVRAFERANRRGRVVATRYHVIAVDAGEAIAKVRAEHERPELPETKGTRYTAASYDGAVQRVDSHMVSTALAEQSIAAGLA